MIESKDVYNKDALIVTHPLVGTTPVTAANYGVIFPAQISCEVLAFAAVWGTASSSGTLQLEKLTGTMAVGSGATLLSSAISTSGVANTVTHGTFLASGTARSLLRGDRLALRVGGTLTGLTDLVISTLIKPSGKGHYAYVLGSAGRT